MHKLGRNDPCSCGSGRKFKRCCLNRSGRPIVTPLELLKHIDPETLRHLQRASLVGQVRPSVHADWNGKKWVAVGDRILASHRWKTFHDFLYDHVIDVLTPAWYQSEIAKPREQCHIFIQWYRAVCDLHAGQPRGHDGTMIVRADGPAAAYMLLAWDLYVLRHHQALLDSIVRRLKSSDHFQAARHELFAAAACVRAGCKIRHEDERDKTTQHPEFLATHMESGREFWVEAKSRHRDGVLGRPGTNTVTTETRAGIERLLREGVRKRPTDGRLFVIMIDVNLPASNTSSPFEDHWCREVLDGACKRECPDGADPFDAVIFTNQPFHYLSPGADAPTMRSLMLCGKQHGTIPPGALVDVFDAVQKRRNVPAAFNDA